MISSPQSECDDVVVWEKIQLLLHRIRQKYLYLSLDSIKQMITQWGEYLNLFHKPRTTGHLPHQGEIYMTQLDPGIGGELQKTRPCLIYSVASANRGDCIICIPIKTLKQKPKHIYRVKLEPKLMNGLNQPSYCSLTDMRSISKNRLGTRKGTLTTTDLERIHHYSTKLFGRQKKEA